MAFKYVIRRAVSSTIGATGSKRHYHHKSFSTLFSNSAPRTGAPRENLFRSSFCMATTQPYSSKSNEFGKTTTRQECDFTLAKMIDSKIQDKVKDLPERFPFNIEEEPGEHTMKLTRNDNDEIITVKPCMSPGWPILIDVKVSKRRFAKGQYMEFTVFARPNEIKISSMKIVENYMTTDIRSDFGKLDENIQKAFYKYLDNRGIDLHLTNFLYEKVNEKLKKKDDEEYLGWLKKVKEYV